jgi:hypothetical protein
MNKKLLLALSLMASLGIANAQPTSLKFKTPKANDTYRVGRTVAISWDTLDAQNNRTFNNEFQFKWAESENGPWKVLALPKNAASFKDVNAKNANAAAGTVSTVLPRKSKIWLQMVLKGNESVNTTVGPINVEIPTAAKADSTITGDITNTVTLSNTKIYQLKKVVFVQDGGVLRVEPGTIVLGDDQDVSALVINRGGKIYAKGEKNKPIVFTSGYAAGSRDRGDWGGVLIMGSAKTNLGEAAVEGGIADGQDSKKNGWFGAYKGVSNDQDSSGVLEYVRIEFAGIAESPDNELNGLTMGAVGSKTVIKNVQVSYGGDDSFEWFGGSVNCKYLIAYKGIDDDFDTDNGFRGKVQFGLSYRMPSVADQSNSEAFESDNDSKASENQPFTAPVFSNMTCIGGVRDTSWTSGSGDGKYNAKYLTAAQIRRNSRLSLYNSLLVGWPAGLELTDNNTVRAAGVDSLQVRYNNFYGIKNNKNFYFGSGTVATSAVDANWLSKSAFDNKFINGTGSVADLAKFENAFPTNITELNCAPKSDADYLNAAKFDVPNLQDEFFTKVNYRGAFNTGITERWDLPWSEYDPVNKEYKATSGVNDVYQWNLDIKVTPNPVNNLSKVVYQLPEDSKVTIKLFNQLGEQVSVIANELQQNQGFYEFGLNADGLNSGAYYLQVITNNGIATKLINVSK